MMRERLARQMARIRRARRAALYAEEVRQAEWDRRYRERVKEYRKAHVAEQAARARRRGSS